MAENFDESDYVMASMDLAWPADGQKAVLLGTGKPNGQVVHFDPPTDPPVFTKAVVWDADGDEDSPAYVVELP